MLSPIGLLYVLIATKCFLSQGGDVVPIRVNGLVNQSILLSPSVDSSRSVQHVYWNFQTYIMASYINNQLTVIEDKFEERLEILDNGRSLRIGELRLEDSGLYAGTITFTDRSKDQKTYNLTVYDYVPVPTIEDAEMKKDGEWCNVTLRCSTSTNTSALSYIWNYKHGISSSTMLYNNTGDTIRLSLQPESWDMEIMCIVQNPVDRKNVSVQKICRNYGRNKIMPTGTTDLNITNSEDITYAEVRRTQQDESKQEPEVRNPPEESNEDIVYSHLKFDTD
ncbi:SLAM family member 5-like isoform X2 [Rana temporaria]|uniref:SLAM family member 5-like isoform X2 n=1 Tax=Rana temporaria TaxID=8407 RepID=UPI001AAC86C3|nr:SLAM family member 5-like isoform X2 [Rana temporaria]